MGHVETNYEVKSRHSRTPDGPVHDKENYLYAQQFYHDSPPKTNMNQHKRVNNLNSGSDR